MATITKTFGSQSSIGQWTVVATGHNLTVGTSSFTLDSPTLKASHTYPNRTNGNISISFDYLLTSSNTTFKTGTGDWYERILPGSEEPVIKPNTTYTLPITDSFGNSKTIATSKIFNNNTSATKTIDIKLNRHWIEACLCYPSSSDRNGYQIVYQKSNDLNWGTIGTITLDAPPRITATTVTHTNDTGYSTGYYANHSTYEFGINTTALYGGKISRVQLQIGNSSIYVTPNAASNATTLKLPLTQEGSFTPIVRVTDSRGQGFTASLSKINITYKKPSISVAYLKRINRQNLKPDEQVGEWIVLKANLTAMQGAEIEAPVIQITENSTWTQSVQWYSSYNEEQGTFSNQITSFPISATSTTLYAKIINGNGGANSIFDTAKSYIIDITPKDGNNTSGTPVRLTLPTAYFTVDFKAGGRGIAFGQPATEDGFYCAMNTAFTGNTTVSKLISPASTISSLKLGNETAVASWRNLPRATASSHGLMSSTDKGRLDSFFTDPTWTVPSSTAVRSVAGGYCKIGKLVFVQCKFNLNSSYTAPALKEVFLGFPKAMSGAYNVIQAYSSNSSAHEGYARLSVSDGAVNIGFSGNQSTAHNIYISGSYLTID